MDNDNGINFFSELVPDGQDFPVEAPKMLTQEDLLLQMEEFLYKKTMLEFLKEIKRRPTVALNVGALSPRAIIHMIDSFRASNHRVMLEDSGRTDEKYIYVSKNPEPA